MLWALNETVLLSIAKHLFKLMGENLLPLLVQKVSSSGPMIICYMHGLKIWALVCENLLLFHEKNERHRPASGQHLCYSYS